MVIRIVAGALALAMFAAPARARDFCPDRPGRGTPPCTVDPGRAVFETSLVDWSRSRDREEAEDAFVFNDALVRWGADRMTELRLGWTMLGTDRTRDRVAGSVERRTGAGDVTVGLRRALVQDRKVGFAVQPFVTAPTGRTPIGAGTWSAGVVLPARITFTKKWSVTLDTEVDAAADESGEGRHLAYSTVFDLNWKATDAILFTAEAYAQRDRDPDGHETQVSLDGAAAWQFTKNSQVDFAAYAGLNRATPRVQLVLGLAHRF